MRRMRIPVTAKLLQRLAAARIRVAEHRRGAGTGSVLERQHVGAIARQGIAFGPGDRLHLLRIALGEARVEKRHQRNIEAVEPDDGLLARIAVVVERPRRRDDEVTRMHGGPLTVDGGICAFAFDDKAQRRLAVTVTRRNLAGQDQLQAGVQAVGDRRRAAQTRVLHHQHAPLSFTGGDEAAGLHQVRAHLLVAPQRRHAGRGRCRRHQVAESLPQRSQAVLVDALVKRLALVSHVGLGEQHDVIPPSQILSESVALLVDRSPNFRVPAKKRSHQSVRQRSGFQPYSHSSAS